MSVIERILQECENVSFQLQPLHSPVPLSNYHLCTHLYHFPTTTLALTFTTFQLQPLHSPVPLSNYNLCTHLYHFPTTTFALTFTTFQPLAGYRVGAWKHPPIIRCVDNRITNFGGRHNIRIDGGLSRR